MASITLPATAVPAGALRPLNILHDLPQVADLIELCFESSMDDEGQSYLQQMRRASRDQAFLSWAGRVMDSTSMPLAGYVWEEGGKIIGNVSLVFQSFRGRKIGMIANVATHPDCRRRGIGRALTERAMLGGRQKGAQDFWLHVRHDNPTAIKIYSELGFVERGRRTTYRTKTAPSLMEADAAERRPGGITLTRPSPKYWPVQHQWLQRAHPDELGWYAHWDWSTLGPGVRNALYRLFVQFDIRQWAAVRDGQLLAAVSWLPTLRVADVLWLAAPQNGDDAAVSRVLEAARRDLSRYNRLTLEYPAGEMVEAIEYAGFEATRTLLWMWAPATPARMPRMKAQKETTQ
jgi:ribosomal protein S18 acetylase RimI-like enzyme